MLEPIAVKKWKMGMKKRLTSILVILTLIVLILLSIVKYKSVTDLETDPIVSNSKKNIDLKESNKKRISSTKPKRIHHYAPEDSESLISKLKANITTDDVIVTGGYKADNGNIRYSFIQADKVEHNGQESVKIKIKNIEISPETANDSNLDYLETKNSKIFDHFGILTSEEYKASRKRLNKKAIQAIAMPDLLLNSGKKGQLYIGDDNALKLIDISIKPTIISDGSFDIELEAKQNRN